MRVEAEKKSEVRAWVDVRGRLVCAQAYTHAADSVVSTGRTAVPTVPRNASVFFADLREQHIVGRLVTMRTEA